jgi:hypothetical protein
MSARSVLRLESCGRAGRGAEAVHERVDVGTSRAAVRPGSGQPGPSRLKNSPAPPAGGWLPGLIRPVSCAPATAADGSLGGSKDGPGVTAAPRCQGRPAACRLRSARSRRVRPDPGTGARVPRSRGTGARFECPRNRLDAHQESLQGTGTARLRPAGSRLTTRPLTSRAQGLPLLWEVHVVGSGDCSEGRPHSADSPADRPHITGRPNSRRSERSWAMHSGAVCAGSNPAGGADR